MVRAKRAAEAKARAADSASSGKAESTPAAPGQGASTGAGQAPPARSGPLAEVVAARPDPITSAPSATSGQCPQEQDLSQKQQAALAELQRGTPFKVAAQRAGVHQATLYRWVKSDPTFRAAYNLWEQTTRESARAKLLMAADIAVERIVRSIDVDPKFAFAVLKELGIFHQRPAGQIDPQHVQQEIELEMKTDLTALKARLAQLAELADAKKPVQSRVVRTITHEQPAEAPADENAKNAKTSQATA